ncbi:MAG: hypothetical protein HYV09_16170 [Deltaproteobacteria bacterium]|nr:hypothetical protein [Deltaproteobacteria bacterium]
MSPGSDRGEIPVSAPRESFAIGVLLPFALLAIAANVVGGLLAPGWVGVGAEAQVARWRKWANLTSVSAAMLGMLALMVLVLAVVGNPRTSLSTRLVSTFGAGLVFTFVAVAIGRVLEPAQLVVLFAGAFAVLVAATVEAVAPTETRALGIQLGLLAFAALLRVIAWGVAWNALKRGTPNAYAWGQVAASAALAFEVLAQVFLVIYLVHRPGARGAVAAFVALAIAFGLTTWTLGASLSSAGTARDALQRALSLRVQGSGPLPSWVSADAATNEIALVERHVRVSLLPLVFTEVASVTLPLAAIASATRGAFPLLCAMGLAVLSRGQVDTPLRGLELVIAALAALTLSRAAREAEAPSARGRQ